MNAYLAPRLFPGHGTLKKILKMNVFQAPKPFPNNENDEKTMEMAVLQAPPGQDDLEKINGNEGFQVAQATGTLKKAWENESFPGVLAIPCHRNKNNGN